MWMSEHFERKKNEGRIMDEKKVREAIEFLQIQIRKLEEQKDWDEYGQPLYSETLDMAVEQYGIAIEALEKQLPKKPNFEGDGYAPNGTFVYDTWICPSCEGYYEVDYDDYVYCPQCGQKLDWSE